MYLTDEANTETSSTKEKKYKLFKTQADRHIYTPDMLTHRGVHDACAVCPDGVGNVSDVDGV